MTIGLIAGSTREAGTTRTFLRELKGRWAACVKTSGDGSGAASLLPPVVVLDAPDTESLPLFTSTRLAAGRPAEVEAWATFVKTCDALVIATPEYAHGVPAALKSALEWLVASGEFSRKRTLLMTVTPNAPRGDKCLEALTWVLRAMDAEVVAAFPAYATAATLEAPRPDEEWPELVDEALALLWPCP